ncbi:hypothetical protein CVT24_001738 [Panaeolus cyanescens]|uniref:HNH nuclease domain-containing protein n=1 Tax=Panaeolus cyanescens TaxID=181874 RepID=A0A409YFR2_9AGAR|nr:hypothetical protein CVT24_001738 [Panaeolus cyanescens]
MTPQTLRRPPSLERRTTAARKHAEKRDYSKTRCLIENCSSTKAVELAHIFDRQRTTKLSIIEAIEWGWAMRKGSLNLDTSRNILFLGASLHEIYKYWKWALVPEESVVRQYFHKSFDLPLWRKDFRDIQGETFKYTFQPIQDMEDIYIARQSTDNSQEVIIHEYPFKTLPVLTSHVHPKYVILHLGQILCSGLVGSTAHYIMEKYPWLELVEALYIRWVAAIPRNADQDPTYAQHYPQDDVQSLSSLSHSTSTASFRTPLRRIRRLRPSVDDQSSSSSSSSDSSSSSTSGSSSQGTTSNGTGSSNASHDHKTGNSDARLLTYRALREQARDDKLENPKWTKNRIASWAEQCGLRGIVHSLEWNWGLKKGSLDPDLDTPGNFFFLGSSLHQMYREWKWVLIPEASALDQFIDPDILWPESYGRAEFPEVKENTFNYIFQPVFDMEDVYVTRVSDENTQHVDIHEYPFDKFPVISSSIDPRFVILHVGQMLTSSKIELSVKDPLREKYPWLDTLEDLFSSWVGSVPHDAFKDPTYVPRPDGYISSCSESSDSGVYVEFVYCETTYRRGSIRSSSASLSTTPIGLPCCTNSQNEDVPDERPYYHTVEEIQGEVVPLTHHALEQQDNRADLQSARWTIGRISSWAIECTNSADSALPPNTICP